MGLVVGAALLVKNALASKTQRCKTGKKRLCHKRCGKGEGESRLCRRKGPR